jgi:hemerythrin-like domain-containing protein
MINRFFSQDHREIDALIVKLRGDVSGPEGAPAMDAGSLAESFRAIEERLDRHIRWEEELLFPSVEERMPELADGPGRVMRGEHQEIRAHLRGIRDALDAAQPGAETLRAVRDGIAAVEAVLGEHNEKEEQVYYPLCDSLFTPEEAARFLDRIREMR